MQGRSAADEVGELNLNYLLLAQRLIREDRATAMFRFGLNEDAAQAIGIMPLSKIVQMSTTGIVLCRIRLEERAVLDALLNDGQVASLGQAHVAIILASQKVGDGGVSS